MAVLKKSLIASRDAAKKANIASKKTAAPNVTEGQTAGRASSRATSRATSRAVSKTVGRLLSTY